MVSKEGSWARSRSPPFKQARNLILSYGEMLNSSKTAYYVITELSISVHPTWNHWHYHWFRSSCFLKHTWYHVMFRVLQDRNDIPQYRSLHSLSMQNHWNWRSQSILNPLIMPDSEMLNSSKSGILRLKRLFSIDDYFYWCACSLSS